MSLNAAIISHYWAILPEALEALIAIAERRMDDKALLEMKAKAEAEGRWPPRHDALILPGAQPMAGARGTYQREGVAIIPVIGPIIPHASMFTEISGANSVDGLTASLRAANANPDIRTIAMVFDSPGGAVTGIHELAGRLRGSAKPVESFVYGVGASAAYWLATQTSKITMAPTALVGSIGVAAATSVQVGPSLNGEKRVDITSTNAPNKRPDVSTEEGISSVRSLLDKLESLFIADVASGRKVSREKVIADFGRGGLLVGSDAVSAGMADVTSSFDAWFDDLASRNKIMKADPTRRMAAEAFLATRAG